MNDLLANIKTPTKPTKKALVYTDGGSRGNPGLSAAGWVLYTKDLSASLIEIDRGGLYTGHQTNNVAEYFGLIEGLRMALDHDITDLWVRMDSKLIIEQMSGNWKIKHPDMKQLHQKAKALQDRFNQVDFTYIPREKNKVADAIVNQVLDKQLR